MLSSLTAVAVIAYRTPAWCDVMTTTAFANRRNPLRNSSEMLAAGITLALRKEFSRRARKGAHLHIPGRPCPKPLFVDYRALDVLREATVWYARHMKKICCPGFR